MTSKEKAEELHHKFSVICNDTEMGKKCALIVVDENVKMLKTILNESTNVYQSLNTPKKLCIDLLNPLLIFWQQVKQEIELL